jgi:hypothetical protein
VVSRNIINTGRGDGLANALGSLISGNGHAVPSDDNDTENTADAGEEESDDTTRSETIKG